MKNLIVPIGCDCHAAYVLQKLNVRKQSLPFDWVGTPPSKGVTYVHENLKNKFKYYLSDLTHDEHGEIVSAHYGYAYFAHEKDLIDNQMSRLKLSRRTDKMVKFFKKNDCYFLYVIPSDGLSDEALVEEFLTSAREFSAFIKPDDRLLVYIRFEENEEENKINCDKLYNELLTLPKVSVSKYLRKTEKFGIWGNEDEYDQLLESLGLNYKEHVIANT